MRLEAGLEGKLAFERTVRIDGHVTGSIESKEGGMVVGEKEIIHMEPKGDADSKMINVVEWQT